MPFAARLQHSALQLLALLTALTALAAPLPADPPAPRPNIIVILSDDMGFSDLGCYGGEIRTPALDSLAAAGLRFTQFYNTARCCPTRASLLTGLYPHQAGVGHMMDDRGLPGYTGNLHTSASTIAELLKPVGYRNYAVGKWHVTRHADAAGPKHNWPLQRGFDGFYGTIHGAGSFYDPSSLVRDNQMISPYADPEYQPQTYYYTDAITDHAIGFVRQHTQLHAQQPFFLYVAYTAAHWPMHALPEDIARYRGRYDQGYQPVREARFRRAAELGLIDPSQPMAPGFGDFARPAQPTLPVMKPEDFAAAGSTPAQTRDGFPVRMGKQVVPGPADTYVAYGRAWATVSNTPFREYKHWVHEGGISTPLIAHWPAGIAARGELRHSPGHLIDIAATCCDVAGATVPDGGQPLEGVTLLPAFAGQPLQREAIYWEHEGNRAVRAGRWKLVAKHDQPRELYDIDTDRVEANNLADKQPDRVRELSLLYDRWVARASVAPLPLPEPR